jgi:ABC-2 type transport system permease protein
MFKALLRIQFASLWAALTRSTTGKKKSGRGRTALVAILFIYMIGCFFVMFGGMFYVTAVPLSGVGLAWFYFSLAGIVAAALCFIGSVFMAQQQLFNARDNELLLSMPIPSAYILGSRMASLLLVNYGLELIVFIPAGVVWCMQLPVTAMGVVSFVLVCLLLPFLVLTFTCLFAWLLALISSRMRYKTAITLVLSLGFLGLYMYAVMNMQNYLMALLESSAIIAGSVEAYAYPAYALGMAVAEGDLVSLLGFAACCLLPFALVCALLSRFFSSVTAKRASVRIKYRRTELKAAGAMSALLGKELRRFASNSMIILNSALGSVFLVIMGVAALIYRDRLLEVLGLMPGGGGDMLAGVAVLALAFMGALDYISSATISLEGKSLWIPKTIPVPVRTILMAKVLLNVVIALPATFIASACVAIALPMTAAERLFVVLIPSIMTVFISLYGVVINLRFPKFDYINEVNVVKNSLSVCVCLFSSWGILAAPALLYVFVLSDVLSMTVFLGICTALLLIACLLLYLKLCRSEERFLEL